MEAHGPHDEYCDLRERMVRQQVVARGVKDPAVLTALRRVPRHRFAPHLSPDEAYADGAFPLCAGQTISQPYIVARMSALLRVEPGLRVLEVGTGSGYQAAVLLELGAELWTIERVPELAAHARALLRELYPDHPWRLDLGDGTNGHPDAALFDRILVTAAAREVPDALLDQLAPHGRLVAPLGPHGDQHLMTLTKQDTHVQQKRDIACRFVPLVAG